MKYEVLPYERSRNLRIDKGFTQKEVAQLLNVQQNTYCQYEIGKIKYPVEVLIRLALLYDTSVDYLLELTDDPEPYERNANAAVRIQETRPRAIGG